MKIIFSFFAFLFGVSSASAFAGGDGTAGNPYQISTAIQLDSIRYNLSASFVLISDITAGAFNPITGPNGTEAFSGTLNGNGHMITGLSINTQSLFGGAGYTLYASFVRVLTGEIINVNFEQCTINGLLYAGGIASLNQGKILYCTFSGTLNVMSSGTTVYQVAGGICASNTGGSLIGDSCYIEMSAGYTAGAVCGNNGGTIDSCTCAGSVGGVGELGGMIGINGGMISDSHSWCIVTNSGAGGSGSGAGGFVESNQSGGTITNCQAFGNVSSSTIGNVSSPQGGDDAGGFCAVNTGTIMCSTATGVTTCGNDNGGGFCGFNEGGIIQHCQSQGSVTAGNGTTGGFVGNNVATISECSSTGSATGNTSGVNNDGMIGGFCGWNHGGDIGNSYSSGTAYGMYIAGGFCGENDGSIDTSYSTGGASVFLSQFQHSPICGGFCGCGGGCIGSSMGTFLNCYWDKVTSGLSAGLGSSTPDSSAVVGEITSAMKLKSTFAGWDFSNIWSISSGEYPTLQPECVIPSPYSITAIPNKQTFAIGDSILITVDALHGSTPLSGVTVEVFDADVQACIALSPTNQAGQVVYKVLATHSGWRTIGFTGFLPASGINFDTIETVISILSKPEVDPELTLDTIKANPVGYVQPLGSTVATKTLNSVLGDAANAALTTFTSPGVIGSSLFCAGLVVGDIVAEGLATPEAIDICGVAFDQASTTFNSALLVSAAHRVMNSSNANSGTKNFANGAINLVSFGNDALQLIDGNLETSEPGGILSSSVSSAQASKVLDQIASYANFVQSGNDILQARIDTQSVSDTVITVTCSSLIYMSKSDTISNSRISTLSFSFNPNRPQIPNPIFPIYGTDQAGIPPVITWDSTARALTYQLEVSNDSTSFPNVIQTHGKNVIQSVTLIITDIVDTFYRDTAMNLVPTTNYYWRVRGIGESGLVGNWSQIYQFNSGAMSSVNNEAPLNALRISFYPNPVSASATIFYSLAAESSVSITIYDALGRVVASPVVGEMESAGQHETTFDTQDLPPGVYTCRLSAGDAEMFAKMVVVR